MKRFYIVMGAILAIVLLFVISRCDFGSSVTPTKFATIVYTDNTIYEDERDVLLVTIPSVTGDNGQIPTCGGAILPTSTALNKNGEEVTIVSGQLLIMEFTEKLIIGQQNNVKGFVNEPSKVEVLADGFSFKKVDEVFEICIPTEYFNFTESGGTLNFYKKVEDEKPAYSTVITSFSSKQLTISVSGENVMTIVNSMAFGKVDKID